METQANAPAPAQAQTPVHPVHQETATLNALTQWVSQSEDNDPHQGTDLEAPAKAQEQQQEASPPAEEKPQEEVVEFDEDTPFFELEYNGETQKLTAKQIREGYLAKQDYHRNIQKVKAEESALQEKVRQAALQAQSEYVQKLEQHKQAVQRLSGVKNFEEIQQLAQTDPAAAQQEMLRMISVNQTLQNIEAEQRQAHQKLQLEQQAALQQAILKSRETLERDIKDFPQVYPKVLETVSKEYGFDPKDVAQVHDSRLIKVFHDAYQYRQLQQAKPEISKKVVAVPKVVKPGSAEKPNPAKEDAERLHERARKTGKLDDAVAAYMARQNKKKG